MMVSNIFYFYLYLVKMIQFDLRIFFQNWFFSTTNSIVNFLGASGAHFGGSNYKLSIFSRWWFQIFLFFSPLFGEDSHFD